VLHQVGVGTLGPVFRTYEPTRDRLVAVKVFRLDITPEQAQTLADELTKAAEAGLFHPSIVEPIAAGVQGTVAYRADEYVAAESLDVAMRHYAPAALERVLPFITQLAGAVDFARAAGVGHGALHPRDIFVTPDEARATGFGVVDALERVGLRAPVRRPYSAPERIDGQEWGTPADVFSLAAIAFELLTGRRPSGIGDQIGTLAGAAVGDQADALRAVLARAMSETPVDRFPDALSFASALEAAARPGAPVPHYESSSPVSTAGTVLGTAAIAGKPPVAGVEEDDYEHEEIQEIEEIEEEEDSVEIGADATLSKALGVVGAVEDEKEDDDIVAERDEDEAHVALIQSEQQTPPPPPEGDPTRLFDDEQVEVAGGRLMFDAAQVTLEGEHPHDRRFNYEFIDPPPTAAPLNERADEPPPPPLPVIEPTARPVEESRRRARPIVVPPKPIEEEREPEPEPVVPPLVRPQETADHFGTLSIDRPEPWDKSEPPRPRRAMLPLAIAAMPLLLLGFGAGYLWRGRSDTPQTASVAAPASRPAETPAASTPPVQSAKPYSEQAVTPPPAAPPPASQPVNPPPTAPSVPGDAPSPGRGSAPAPDAARPAPPAPSTGKLQVRSNPSGASVTLNGRWRGRTPLTLDDLAFGNYTVRVVSPGYDVAREEITLSSSAASRNLSVKLQRPQRVTAAKPSTPPSRPAAPAAAPPTAASKSPLTGSIYVDSRPRGARVFIDGKEIGTTPVQIPGIRIGSHVVRLQLADHRIWSNSVSVSAGQESRVTGSLEPIVR
jgi:serine/threonine protein kinase